MRREGAERHLLAEYIPDFAPDGSVRGCYTLTIDITQRRAAELEIARSEQRKNVHWTSSWPLRSSSLRSSSVCCSCVRVTVIRQAP